MHDIVNRKIGFTALALVCAALLALSLPVDASVPVPALKPVINEVVNIEGRLGKVPVPSQKPNFARPAVQELLTFGKVPVPRRKPMGRSGRPLSSHDAALYKKIFAYQSVANWDDADDVMGQLDDFRLRGHVLYQRYMHPTAYKTGFDELNSWMASYADHPGADKVYKLAMKRLPNDFKGTVRRPDNSRGVNGYLDILSDRSPSYRSSKKRGTAEREKISKFEKTLNKDIGSGAPTRAYKKLLNSDTAKLLDSVEYDALLASIANSYLMSGNLGKAYDLAAQSANRSAEKVPVAGWVGGLVAWQKGQYRQAAAMFELTAKSPYASSWTAAAGAYWASRAHMRAGNVKDVTMWLRRAADHPRTFYGLIATRALGWDFDFDWSMPDFTQDHKAMLGKYAEARRAMLLVDAGQYHLAEKELRQIDPKAQSGMKTALLAYAHEVGLPSYSMRLASAVKTPEGGLYDAALFPLSPWKPQGGYKVDRALIHALIRQESRFNPMAESHSGASGLMQLMPATASFVSGRRDYRSREGRYNLKEPQLNLDIGQRYVESLLYQDHVGTELFSLLTAYNAGPGNLRKWKGKYAAMQGDPLLFVEMIPMRETRAFVERVMANYWIYRMRLGQPTPSLDAVVEGSWARYVQLDQVRKASL